MSTRTRHDWILWAQLAFALVATAHAEYTLVTALDQHWAVAGAITGALDLYVVRALQKSKDVLPAVLVMVAANVASVLITRGVLNVSWPVLAAVGALAPLLVWRGHALRVHSAPHSQEAGAVSAPVPGPEYAPEVERVQYGCVWQHDECAHSDGECTLTQPLDVLGPALLPYPATDTVTAPVLELHDRDRPYLDGAQEYVEFTGSDASLRGLMKHLSIGQPRAQRLLAHLETEGWL